MATKPLYTGHNDVIDAFETLYQPDYTYSVWDMDRSIVFQWPYEDHEKGKKFFEDNVTAVDQSGNDNMFLLRFHPKQKANVFIDKKTPIISTTPIRIKQIEEMGEVTGNYVRPWLNGGNSTKDQFAMFENMQTLKELPGKISDVIDSRFTEYETRLSAVENGEPAGDSGVMGMIGKAMENPQIMNMVPQLVQGVIGLLQSFIPVAPPATTQAINGTDPVKTDKSIEHGHDAHECDLDKLNKALDRLEPHCHLDTDLELLADMAENNPAMFKMVLNSLRASKQ